MIYYDIHTHKANLNPNICAIESVDLRKPFRPQKGKFYTAGIHPWYADYDLLPILHELALLPNIVAIGEAGLDKLSETEKTMQKEIFEAQIQISEKVRKPLIIHCVKAWDELLEIKKNTHPTMPWIIHGFRGKASLAEQLIKAQLYLSFGEFYNIEALKIAWEAQRLLAETDDKEIEILEVYKNISGDLQISETALQQEIENIINSQLTIKNVSH